MGTKYYCDVCKKEFDEHWRISNNMPSLTNFRFTEEKLHFNVDVSFVGSEMCTDCLLDEMVIALYWALNKVKKVKKHRMRMKDEKDFTNGQ